MKIKDDITWTKLFTFFFIILFIIFSYIIYDANQAACGSGYLIGTAMEQRLVRSFEDSNLCLQEKSPLCDEARKSCTHSLKGEVKSTELIQEFCQFKVDSCRFEECKARLKETKSISTINSSNLRDFLNEFRVRGKMKFQIGCF